MLAFGRRAFRLALATVLARRSCLLRPEAWVLAWCAVLAGPLLSARGQTISRALHHAIGHVLHASLASGEAGGSVDFCGRVADRLRRRDLAAGAAFVAATRCGGQRSQRPRVSGRAGGGRAPWAGFAVAVRAASRTRAFTSMAMVVLAYRLIGETAVISGDPVAPEGEAPRVLASFRELARGRGWRGCGVGGVGASPGRLPQRSGYGRCARGWRRSWTRRSSRSRAGPCASCASRSCAWSVAAGRSACSRGASSTTRWAREIDAFEADWRRSKPRLLGFAMGMGAFDAEVGPDDLYLLARSPEGRLCAVMRFVSHCGRLSLDTMHRLHETPNGLNEALVCRALAVARERGVPRGQPELCGSGSPRCAIVRLAPAVNGRLQRIALRVLGRPLSDGSPGALQREVLSRVAPPLPRLRVTRGACRATTLRVLQAEGHLPQRQPRSARAARTRLAPMAGLSSGHAAA